MHQNTRDPHETSSGAASFARTASVGKTASNKRPADTSQDEEGPSKKPKVSKDDHVHSDPKMSELRHAELEAGLQALNGALLIVHHSQGARLSSLAITVCRTAVTFWYIDPCGIVMSDGDLCLMQNFADFVAAIVALEGLDATRWGAIPRLNLPRGKSMNNLLFAGTLQDCSFDIPEGSAADGMQHRVTFEECVYSQYALVGRRTVVYAARADPPFAGQGPAERIVAKLSYQVTSRRAEDELIAAAQEKGVPHIPTVYGRHDLFDIETLQDGVRARVVKHCGAFYNYENRVARIIVVKMYTPLRQRLHKHPGDLIRMVDEISECKPHSNALWKDNTDRPTYRPSPPPRRRKDPSPGRQHVEYHVR
ncbi:hypothetical protein GY45DRAFT_469330 [Cubamyces sp. BRFM 1775]|nr:hypothetical protein GY45DRAFT_469330 [Cubamyces sp. BRFM 1775]